MNNGGNNRAELLKKYGKDAKELARLFRDTRQATPAGESIETVCQEMLDDNDHPDSIKEFMLEMLTPSIFTFKKATRHKVHKRCEPLEPEKTPLW